MSKSLSEKARELEDVAVRTIVDVMTDPFAENKDRLAAAREILDRGHGKPSQAIIAVPGEKARREAAALYTDAELDQIIDAEFEEIERRALPAPVKDPLLA